MHYRLFAKVHLSSLLFNQGLLTLEGTMNPLKSYYKCWMNTCIYTQVDIFEDEYPSLLSDPQKVSEIT